MEAEGNGNPLTDCAPISGYATENEVFVIRWEYTCFLCASLDVFVMFVIKPKFIGNLIKHRRQPVEARKSADVVEDL